MTRSPELVLLGCGGHPQGADVAMAGFLSLAVLYGLVGLGSVIALFARRKQAPFLWSDAPLLLAFWPLYGPFLLSRQPEDAVAGREATFLAALRKVEHTPLAKLLPDAETVRLLAGRLRVAAQKVEEIDGILMRPEFSEEAARKRQQELRDKGASDCAISTAGIRLQNILKLRSLRDRFSQELDEVGELLTQLTCQAEVVRLAGTPDDSLKDLVQELLSRIEGLDQVLDDDPPLLEHQ